ncbi:RHS repeat domain-containing protein [Rhizorhabdus histidinilytica]|uniref:RHS repeat domain-containing protein n=1 Tax=Rhizorhabdus histidinilytica TaxID=439228 RepID=UPI00321F9D77
MMRAFMLLAALGLPSAAMAAETITYTYDDLGRLVKVVHSDTVNNGETVNYSFDAADNRTNVTTTGA